MEQALWKKGNRLQTGINTLAQKHGLEMALESTGKPSWILLQFKEVPGCDVWEIKSLFMQEMFARGILTINAYNISYSHTELDIDLTQRYDRKLWMRE